MGALFVALASDFGVIPPGATHAILLPFDPSEPGQPVGGSDATHLILGIDLYLVDRDEPIMRHFTFPACSA